MEALLLTARRTNLLRSPGTGVFRFRSVSSVYSFTSSSYERAERDNARLEAINDTVPQKVSKEDMEGADKADELADKMKHAAGQTAEFVADAAAEGTRRVAQTADSVGDTMGKIKDKIVGDDGEVKVLSGENEKVGKRSTVDELRSNAGGYDKNAY